MCGIIGYAGSNIKSFNKHKFNLIGVYNDSRGGDSCGVSVDGKIKKGMHNMKLFRSFISINEIKPEEHPTVIAHTRKSSVGSITIDNAHPFEFTIDEDAIDVNLIGCHNGTIHNHEELAEEFDVSKTISKTTVGVNGTLTTTNRKKTDSQIILQILAENPGDYSVLEKYYGGAALLWYNPSEPNIVYVFKGESRKYSTAVATVEERPLFYFKEEDGMYISSLEDPLFAIGGNTNNVDEFDTNTVYKIIDGDIDNAEKIAIDRSKVSQSSFYKGNYSTPRNSQYNTDNYSGSRAGYSYLNDIMGEDENTELPFNDLQFPALPTKDLQKPTLFNIHDESLVCEKKKSLIYCEKLRYKRNGHLITGVYTFIKDWGFIYVGTQSDLARKEFKSLIGKSFNNGHFIVTANKKDKFVPFNKKDYKNNDVFPLFHFVDGIMMRTSLDYEQLRENKSLAASMKSMSEASMYPVTYHKNRQAVSKQNIYYNGYMFTGTVAPLGSKFIYKIANGNVVERNDVDVNFTEVINKKTRRPQEVKKDLLKIITTDLSKEPKTPVVKRLMTKRAEKSSNELLLMATQKNILPMYAAIPEVIGQIRKYEGSANRRKILNSLTVISNEFEKIVKLNDNVE